MSDHLYVEIEHLLLEADDIWPGMGERLGTSREVVRTAVERRMGQSG